MGLLSGLLGNVSEINGEKLEQEFATFLIPGEHIEHAFRLIRDLVVFTNKRLVMVDKQGMTGKKKEYLSIPYGSIVRFSMETKGHFDLDAEIKLWLRGSEFLQLQFSKDKNIFKVYQLLGTYVL